MGFNSAYKVLKVTYTVVKMICGEKFNEFMLMNNIHIQRQIAQYLK